MRLGLVELARLEVHAAQRGAQLAVRVRRLALLAGEGLQQRGGGRKVLQYRHKPKRATAVDLID